MIEKLVSGGQTGADIAALDVAGSGESKEPGIHDWVCKAFFLRGENRSVATTESG